MQPANPALALFRRFGVRFVYTQAFCFENFDSCAMARLLIVMVIWYISEDLLLRG